MAYFGTVDIIKMADFVEAYCKVNEVTLTHLQLQKILYYIQSWHLAYFHNNIFPDAQPEAWVNGPVYREIYDKYYPARINEYLVHYRIFTPGDNAILDRLIKEFNLSDRQTKFLNAVLEHYCNKSNEELILMTHSELPWNEAREGLGPFEYSARKISLKTMEDYYSRKNKN